MPLDRRALLHNAALGVFAFLSAGREVLLTPKEARAAGVPLRTLSPQEAMSLETFADTLLPGAREAGVAHFVDQQISIAPGEALLTLKYLDWPPPFAAFYREGLSAVDAASKVRGGSSFAGLAEEARRKLVEEMIAGSPAGWAGGVPAPLFYFGLRSDAIDVVYGTVDGFAKLGIPYMPHILPTTAW
jgi:gluconate 2-dehydrogenase subunit 3-like protein